MKFSIFILIRLPFWPVSNTAAVFRLEIRNIRPQCCNNLYDSSLKRPVLNFQKVRKSDLSFELKLLIGYEEIRLIDGFKMQVHDCIICRLFVRLLRSSEINTV